MQQAGIGRPGHRGHYLDKNITRQPELDVLRGFAVLGIQKKLELVPSGIDAVLGR